MQVGYTVVPRAGGTPLRSGCEAYPYAVVGSVQPFILISPDGTMLWASTYAADLVEIKGRATDKEIQHMRKRMHREYKEGRYLPNCVAIRDYAARRGLAAPSLNYEGQGHWTLSVQPGDDLAETQARLAEVASECGIFLRAAEGAAVQVDPIRFVQPKLDELAPVVAPPAAPGIGAQVRVTEEWLAKGSPAEQVRFRGRLGVVTKLSVGGAPEVTFAAHGALKEERLQTAWRRLEVVSLQPGA